ncbi:MAG TPA: sulfotransferase [Streptosporangiaceae bacterium]
MTVGERTEAAPGDWTVNTYPTWPSCGDHDTLIRRAAHWGVVTAGKPTARSRMLPSFLIVGAERGGTTSMYYYLSQHPALFSSILPKKEVHYFDLAYHRGLGWYQAHFPLVARARLATRGTGVAPVAYEGSPYYMFHPLAAGRINRDLPGVRVIALLRDPVERAYSAHSNQFGMGHEKEPFERALELEDARLAGEEERLTSDPGYYSRRHWLFSYRTRGHYVEQLERMERVFGRERMHVIDSGDFFADPESSYHQTLEFLGVPRLGSPAFTPKNGRTRSPMPESLRASLEEHYRPYDERLAAWLGREPSWRRRE